MATSAEKTEFRPEMDPHSLRITVGGRRLGNLLWHGGEAKVEFSTPDPLLSVSVATLAAIVDRSKLELSRGTTNQETTASRLSGELPTLQAAAQRAVLKAIRPCFDFNLSLIAAAPASYETRARFALDKTLTMLGIDIQFVRSAAQDEAWAEENLPHSVRHILEELPDEIKHSA